MGDMGDMGVFVGLLVLKFGLGSWAALFSHKWDTQQMRLHMKCEKGPGANRIERTGR